MVLHVHLAVRRHVAALAHAGRVVAAALRQPLHVFLVLLLELLDLLAPLLARPFLPTLLPGFDAMQDRVSVYVSQSYNIGGLTLLVPRDQVEEVHVSVEDAMRFALTAGVSAEEAASGAPPASPR